MAVRQHVAELFDDAMNDTDFRPDFTTPTEEDDEQPPETDDKENENQGELAMVDDDYFSADTKFCIAMSLEWRETTMPTNPDVVEITEYEYRRISLPPDTAAYIISRLKERARKTIADALVFQLIKDEGVNLAAEELDDGGVAPVWRNRENDPVMDILRYCTHLEALYMRIVRGEHVDNHMNNSPDAPKEM